jgi:hypothetical protein
VKTGFLDYELRDAREGWHEKMGFQGLQFLEMWFQHFPQCLGFQDYLGFQRLQWFLLRQMFQNQ